MAERKPQALDTIWGVIGIAASILVALWFASLFFEIPQAVARAGCAQRKDDEFFASCAEFLLNRYQTFLGAVVAVGAALLAAWKVQQQIAVADKTLEVMRQDVMITHSSLLRSTHSALRRLRMEFYEFGLACQYFAMDVEDHCESTKTIVEIGEAYDKIKERRDRLTNMFWDAAPAEDIAIDWRDLLHEIVDTLSTSNQIARKWGDFENMSDKDRKAAAALNVEKTKALSDRLNTFGDRFLPNMRAALAQVRRMETSIF